MFRGKGGIVYTILKLALYVTAYWEFFSLNRNRNQATQVILISIVVVSSFFRQLYLYKKERRFGYGRICIILDFALGVWIAALQPVEYVVLILTPTIIESVVVHSISFGGSTTGLTLFSIITIDTLSHEPIYDHFIFFRRIFIGYVLGYILVFVVSYLASLQFRERERVERINKELEQAYKKLLDNASKLEELSVEKERNRMAREIHDTLAHTLTTVVVQMEACKKLMDVDVSRAKAEVIKAQELTRDGLGDVKRTIKALRPQILENSSLAGALHHLFHDIEESAHVKVDFHEDLVQELNLDSATEVALFRVIQESITNAIRHGAAEQIEISMADSAGMLNIDIHDNGKGCTHIKEGFGLKGILERIKVLGGTARFSSSAGRGFLTQISVPYKGGVNSGN